MYNLSRSINWEAPCYGLYISRIDRYLSSVMHLLDFQGHPFIHDSHILLFRFSLLSGSQWSSALSVVCVLFIPVVLISIAVRTQFSAEHFFSAGELDSSCTGSNITDQVQFLSGEQFLNLLPYGY